LVADDGTGLRVEAAHGVRGTRGDAVDHRLGHAAAPGREVEGDVVVEYDDVDTFEVDAAQWLAGRLEYAVQVDVFNLGVRQEQEGRSAPRLGLVPAVGREMAHRHRHRIVELDL